MLTDKDKTYRTVMLLGKETDTQDISGTVLKEMPMTVTEEQVKEAAESFIGDYEQIPPMYSALKVNGKKDFTLHVKCADSVQSPDNMSDYYVSGEVLPLGRYYCVYRGAGRLHPEEATPPTTDTLKKIAGLMTAGAVILGTVVTALVLRAKNIKRKG